MELKQSKKMVITPMMNTITFENFIGCAQETKVDLHKVQLEFYSKVDDFLYLFFNIQTLVKWVKYLKENNETLKSMIDNIMTFQEVHKYALSQIPGIRLREKIIQHSILEPTY